MFSTGFLYTVVIKKLSVYHTYQCISKVSNGSSPFSSNFRLSSWTKFLLDSTSSYWTLGSRYKSKGCKADQKIRCMAGLLIPQRHPITRSTTKENKRLNVKLWCVWRSTMPKSGSNRASLINSMSWNFNKSELQICIVFPREFISS